jgi:hypothetical protein
MNVPPDRPLRSPRADGGQITPARHKRGRMTGEAPLNKAAVGERPFTSMNVN